MEFDIVFGDLQLDITLKMAEGSPFGRLTKGDLLCLQQWIYLACTCFINTRAAYMLGLIDKDKIRGSDAEQENDNE